ncbi:hypothetical protein [Tetragenococcus koreensis]|uniref:hypothetical protein n=1 Tax=Tetragenococcus koreensis TaxID=290335 RepID=UPI000F4E2312|nr:hypothetical protein [Tetragenococcus koreensis]AYW45727.1 hypothetical protein C7K43_07070 [Tetragenococcus koreensis]AYW45759.1 hypothetical protein C7K43_07245 [Tetragenococcus koreensis]GEN92368.1 hypothetical protein TKO01_24140 [Tetragenococcus koreensis]
MSSRNQMVLDKKDVRNSDRLDFALFRKEHERGNYPGFMVNYFESLTLEEQRNYFRAYQTVRAQLRDEQDLIDHLLPFLQKGTVDPTFEREFFLYVLFYGPNLDVSAIYRKEAFLELLNKYAQEVSNELEAMHALLTSDSVFEEGECPF